MGTCGVWHNVNGVSHGKYSSRAEGPKISSKQSRYYHHCNPI